MKLREYASKTPDDLQKLWERTLSDVHRLKVYRGWGSPANQKKAASLLIYLREEVLKNASVLKEGAHHELPPL